MLELHERNLPRRIPYEPDLYVARTDTALVLNAVRSVQQAGTSDALIFRGVRGAGKTWFALDLHCRALRQEFGEQVTSFYISVEPPDEQSLPEPCDHRVFSLYNGSDPDGWSIDQRLQRLLVRIYPYLGVTTARTASLRELDEWADRRFSTRAYQTSLATRVVFVDGAFEVERDLLRLLERHFLSHLLMLPRTLIVILGRGREYHWRNGQLRQRGNVHELAPFRLEEMHEQIKRLHLNGSFRGTLEELQAYGGGVPLTTSVLARFGLSVDTLNTLIDLLLGERHRSLRGYFEMLAPLDGFVEEEIEHLLLDETRLDGRSSWREAREIRQELVNTQLVVWDQAAGVWRMDAALRSPLERWMFESRLSCWEKIHRKMRAYYLTWAKEAEEYRSYFEDRARYHIDQLDHMSI